MNYVRVLLLHLRILDQLSGQIYKRHFHFHFRHIFNFDFPRDMEDYVHRCGRTGRAGYVTVLLRVIVYHSTGAKVSYAIHLHIAN